MNGSAYPARGELDRGRAGPRRPNIVMVLADDMGIGDIGAFNPSSLIPTPNIDKLVRESVSFDDAHSSSAVCTPSRYGLLTGRYCWRSPLKRGVFVGYEPPLIDQSTVTLARMLQRAGYRTGAFGKWHLGLGFAARSGQELDFSRPLPWLEAQRGFEERVDFDKPVAGGPVELGFDQFFGTSGCPTCQPPYGFIFGDRFVDPPRIYDENPPYTGRPGMASPGWRHADADPTIIDEACAFLSGAAGSAEPFFAYVALDAPHEPCTDDVVPALARNMSRAGPRGDLVWLFDYAVGRLRQVLETAGAWRDTLFIVTSDNGALPGDRVLRADGTEMYRTYGHRPSGGWRGYKAHIWEGGHRVPLVLSWPERFKAPMRSQALVCLMDLFATIADLLGLDCPADAEDSVSFCSVLLGEGRPKRHALVHHSQQGVFALRLDDIKLIAGTQGSGGWPPPPGGPPIPGAPGQLYDLSTGPTESENLWDARPALVGTILAELRSIVNGNGEGYL